MRFWIFMLIMNLLIPVTMIGFGKYFINKAPKEVNGIFGYRTPMSMKNKETWEFAHRYCGKLWVTIGWILFIISIIAMILVTGKENSVVGKFGGIINGIQLVFLVGSIFPTESALKMNFDRYGNRLN